MVKKISNMILIVFIFCIFTLNPLAASESVYVKRIDTPKLSLEGKWKEALSLQDEKIERDSFWIVYTIEKLMSEDNNINMCDSDNGIDLESVLFGKRSAPAEQDAGSEIKNSLKSALNIAKNKKSDIKIKKKLVIMFHVNGDGKIFDVNIATLDSKICFEGSSIIWMGEFGDLESLNFLKKTYTQATSTKIKENIIAAIANHQTESEIVPFLKNVIDGKSNEKLRTTAVFWFGVNADEENVDYLMQLVFSDKSREVREQAVFALSISKADNRMDKLIKIVKKSDDMETRKTAVFWLGQCKSAKITDTLSDIANDDSEIELQKSAVFALSQNGGEGSVEKLIDIARNHKSGSIRKEAIFWLGQMDSEEAVDAIIKLAEEN
jgi:hypothetical protein